MSVHKTAAQHLAAQGRGPDDQLIHMSSKEVAGLQALAQAHGGSLTINPKTGLPEAGFLDDILPTIMGAGLTYFTGMDPMTAAAIMGGGTAISTGDLGKGLMAGLGAYGGGAGMAGLLEGGGAAAALEGGGAATNADKLSAALSSPDVNLAKQIGWKNIGMAAAPALMGMLGTQGGGTQQTADATVRPYTYNPGAQQVAPQNQIQTVYQPGQDTSERTWFKPSYTAQTPYTYHAANGGLMALKQGGPAMQGAESQGPVEAMSDATSVGQNTGYPQANISQGAYATPWQTPISRNMVNSAADTGVNQYTGEMNFATGGVTGSGNLDLHIPIELGGGIGNSATVYPFAGSGTSTQTGFTGQNNTAGGGFGAQPNSGSPFGSTPFSDTTNSDTFKGTAAFGGNPQEALKTLFGALGGQTQQNPFQQNAPLQMASGGLAAAYASGGISSLGGYSDGGRLLRGPGDGVSDSIPAVIGDKQPARLADGEFVVPARIVSELGNGSTEAGAKQLYKMMDRIQSARRKTTGKSKVAKDTNAAKYLPA